MVEPTTYNVLKLYNVYMGKLLPSSFEPTTYNVLKQIITFESLVKFFEPTTYNVLKRFISIHNISRTYIEPTTYNVLKQTTNLNIQFDTKLNQQHIMY